MNTLLQKTLRNALGAASLFAISTLHANQVNEFSVFQPVNGISANIYINVVNNNARVVVQSSSTKATVLNNIKPEYITRYANKLYKIGDVDHNGTVDIATLDRVDHSSTRFCYKVYSYRPQSRSYSSQPTYTECDSKAGTVTYAINSDIAINN